MSNKKLEARVERLVSKSKPKAAVIAMHGADGLFDMEDRDIDPGAYACTHVIVGVEPGAHQPNKELQERFDRLVDTSVKKELTTIDICFGRDAKPTYSFEVYLRPK